MSRRKNESRSERSNYQSAHLIDDNAQLLALSGPRNPYPGALGVVAEGALADLILVDGDPLANFPLITDPEKNFLVIMKDGRLFKNLLTAESK